MVRFGFIFAIIATLLAASPALAQSAEPVGVWLTEKGDARVKVSKCGNGICGVIVGLKDPIDRATGQPQVDDKNPNPALRTRPVRSPCASGPHTRVPIPKRCASGSTSRSAPRLRIEYGGCSARKRSRPRRSAVHCASTMSWAGV